MDLNESDPLKKSGDADVVGKFHFGVPRRDRFAGSAGTPPLSQERKRTSHVVVSVMPVMLPLLSSVSV